MRQHRPSRKSRLAPFRVMVDESGVSYSSLRAAVLRGELPVVQIGRAWYLERTDVNQWIESSKQRPR